MKLIIDIPEKYYTKIMRKEEDAIIAHDTCRFVSFGTPIPDNATVCDIEKIRAEIEKHTDGNNHCDEYIDGYNNGMKDALEIIDKYTNGGMSPEVKEHYERLAEHYDKKKGGAI